MPRALADVALHALALVLLLLAPVAVASMGSTSWSDLPGDQAATLTVGGTALGPTTLPSACSHLRSDVQTVTLDETADSLTATLKVASGMFTPCLGPGSYASGHWLVRVRDVFHDGDGFDFLLDQGYDGYWTKCAGIIKLGNTAGICTSEALSSDTMSWTIPLAGMAEPTFGAPFSYDFHGLGVQVTGLSVTWEDMSTPNAWSSVTTRDDMPYAPYTL